jgi:hypothetical protein
VADLNESVPLRKRVLQSSPSGSVLGIRFVKIYFNAIIRSRMVSGTEQKNNTSPILPWMS